MIMKNSVSIFLAVFFIGVLFSSPNALAYSGQPDFTIVAATATTTGTSIDVSTTTYEGASDTFISGKTLATTKYVEYIVNVEESGKYNLSALLKPANDGNYLTVYLNECLIASSKTFAQPEGGWTQVGNYDICALDFVAGINKIRIIATTIGGSSITIQSLSFIKTGEFGSIKWRAANRTTDYGGKAINVYANTTFGTSRLAMGPGAWASYDLNIPRDGAFNLNLIAGAGPGNAIVTVYLNGSKAIEKTINTGSPSTRIALDMGAVVKVISGINTIKIAISGTGDVMFETLTMQYINPIEITMISSNTDEIINNTEIARGSDRISITCTNAVDSSSLVTDNIKLQNQNKDNIPFEISFDKNVIVLKLKQTLGFSEVYQLEIRGITDIYSYTIQNKTLIFNTSPPSTDSGRSSVIIDKSSLNDRNIAISGTILSSENVGIAGRNVTLYITTPSEVESTISKLTTTSLLDGDFSLNYTLPEGSEAGIYKVAVGGEYVHTPAVVNLHYVSKELKNEILNKIRLTTTAAEIEQVFSTYSKELTIDVISDLTSVPNKQLFFAHFISKNYSSVDEFTQDYNANIVLEIINQSMSLDTVIQVFQTEKMYAALGIDIHKYQLIKNHISEFHQSILDLEVIDSLSNFVEKYNIITNDWLCKEYNKTAPTLLSENKSVYIGQTIVLDAGFFEKTDNVKAINLILSSGDETMIIPENVDFVLSGIGSIDKQVTNNKIKFIITFATPKSQIDLLGKISILTTDKSPKTVLFGLSGNIVYSSTIPYDLSCAISNAEFNIEIQENNKNVDIDKSIRKSISSGGGNATVLPFIPQEPIEEIKTNSIFKDVDKAHWAKDSIDKLFARGIITDNEEKLFKPDNNITRNEFIKMMVVTLGIYDEKASSIFADVQQEHWANKYIGSAEKYNLIFGDENNLFHGDTYITREDICVIIFRAMANLKFDMNVTQEDSFDDDTKISVYAKEAVYLMKSYSIVNGIGENLFAPKDFSTRAMVAKLIANFIEECKI